MSCGLINGIPRNTCGINTPGIKRFLITNFDNVAVITPAQGAIGTPVDDGIITDITMAGSPVAEWFEFVPQKQTPDFVETGSQAINTGSGTVEQVVTMVFAKNEASKRNVISLMAQSDLLVIAQDFNDIYWLLGETNGMVLTSYVSNSGKTGTDLSGYTLTLTGNEHLLAREVEGSVITQLGF
jgi:hypothetical protein